MNIPDYETSLYTYLQHKRSKWEENDDLFKKDMIEFMLSMEKKKIEQNCYYLPECLEKENLPMKFKKVNNIPTDDNIQVWWKEILNNYNKEKYGILSGLPLSQPQPLTIWKVKPSKNSDLRFCGADFCLGFINNDNNQDLEIEVVEDDLLGNKIKTTFSVNPNQRTKLTKPVWISRYPYKEFKAYPSHYNFTVLYAWFPKHILNTTDLPDLTME